MTRFISATLLFLVCAMVVGCAAHTPKVPMPGEKAGPVEWREYYDDQFKAFKDKVPPPGEQASLEQRVAYQDAKAAYDKQRLTGMIVGGCVLALSLALFLGTISQL